MKSAALIISTAVAIASGLVGVQTVDATPATFGQARPGGIEVNLGGGTLQRVPCARGAQPGATCYLAR